MIPQNHTFTLTGSEMATLEVALSFYHANCKLVAEDGGPPFRENRRAIKQLRALLAKKEIHRSRKKFTTDQLEEMARNGQWPDDDEEADAASDPIQYCTITLDDSPLITLKVAVGYYLMHCEQELEKGAREPFLARRESLNDIEATLGGALSTFAITDEELDAFVGPDPDGNIDV
jgi:hypothetical protein